MNAINELKQKIREKGGDLGEKDFDKIMKQSASRQGLDPEKGKRTERRVSVMDQIKFKGKKAPTAGDEGRPSFPKAQRGEAGRVGQGRFNRQFAMEKAKLMQGSQAKPSDASRTNNGFKSKFTGKPPTQRREDKFSKHGRRNG